LLRLTNPFFRVRYTHSQVDLSHITSDLINRGLTEQYVMDRATTRWDGPAFITYATRAVRLRMYVHWPHTSTKLTPAALSEYGFFHTGKISYCFMYIALTLFIDSVTYVTFDLQIGVTKRSASFVGAGNAFGNTRAMSGRNKHGGFHSVFCSNCQSNGILSRMSKFTAGSNYRLAMVTYVTLG
jgi:hypothetical protein